MKRLYERVSATGSIDRLDPVVRSAIVEHAEANQLGDVLASATAVCETRSVRLQRNGVLARITRSPDPDREHRSVAVLTPGCILIAVAGDQRGLQVRSARLADISLGPDIALVADFGANVVGRWSGETAEQAASAFYLGLGDDPAGRAFLACLRDAVTNAKAG